MAIVPRQIEEELLPNVFRRRGMPAPASVGPPGNMMMPTQDPLAQQPQPALGNVLQPQQPAAPPPTLADQAMARVQPVPDAPVAPVPQPGNVLAPAIVSPGAPEVSPSGQINDELQTRQARRVETDKRGRPIANITMEGDEQTLDQYDRLARMPPDKKGGGWWPKIRAALLGFAAGGPVGAAAAFGTRALREHFDPELGSREYQQQQMKQMEPAVDSIYAKRKEARAEESQQASTDLAKARIDALKNPKAAASRILKGADGYYSFNPDTKKYEKINEIPTPAGAAKGARYFQNAAGVFRVDPDRPDVGVRVKGIPGAPGKAGEDVGFHNQQLNQAIKEAQAEQKKLDEGMANVPRTVEIVDINNNKRTIANPDYTYNMTRRRQLDDQIRKWKTQMKSAKMAAPAAEEEPEEDNDPLGILDDEP